MVKTLSSSPSTTKKKIREEKAYVLVNTNQKYIPESRHWFIKSFYSFKCASPPSPSSNFWDLS
jgi:hypothetical protein